MLKAEVNKNHVNIEINANLPTLCADLAKILSSINDRLSENDPSLGHEFRVLFTKGYMDGVCFDDDREHMEHYLAEGDKDYKKVTEKGNRENSPLELLNEVLDDFLKFLESKHEELERQKKGMEDSDDEAE